MGKIKVGKERPAEYELSGSSVLSATRISDSSSSVVEASPVDDTSAGAMNEVEVDVVDVTDNDSVQESSVVDKDAPAKKKRGRSKKAKK